MKQALPVNVQLFDQIAQALGGGMSITGNNPEDVIRAGIPIGDLGGGMFAVMGILAAINARHTTGRGQHVDISMLDCQLSMMNYMATMHPCQVIFLDRWAILILCMCLTNL